MLFLIMNFALVKCHNKKKRERDYFDILIGNKVQKQTRVYKIG